MFFRTRGASQALRDIGLSKVAETEYAPGIPEKTRMVPLPEVKDPQNWTIAISDHEAEVAGLHKDLRLIDPTTGDAHSWAIPKAKLPEPGKAVLAIQQPTHTAHYATTFGKDRPERIPKGYGKGLVDLKYLDHAEVYHSDPEIEQGTRLRFNLYKGTGPEEYAIVRTTRGTDLLVNKTLTKERLPHLDIGDKPKLKTLDVKRISAEAPNEVMMPKYDGAHTLLDLDKAGKIPRLYSYRIPRRAAAGIIEHTHKVPLLLNTRVPKELARTTIRAETIATGPTGRAIPAKDIAGMLNAGVRRSRDKQREMEATLVPIAFDVTRYKGKDVSDLPFPARYELLKEIHSQLRIPITEVARTTDEKSKLLEKIRSGRHPLTTEGVVLQPINVSSKATKAKFRPDHDVYVREIYPAIGKDGKPLDRAGGFRYSWTPRGKIVGNVGTGFDHATARDMLNNPDQYKGRVAKVEAETRFESGALSKPAFQQWHLDKGELEKLGLEASIEKIGRKIPGHEALANVPSLKPLNPSSLSNQKQKMQERTESQLFGGTTKKGPSGPLSS